jgi:sensor histidine kinase YesM
VVTYLIGFCFFMALGHLIPDFSHIFESFGLLYGILICMVVVFMNVTVPYNLVLLLTEGKRFRHLSPLQMQVAIFVAVVLSTAIINASLSTIINGSTRLVKYSVLWSFYLSGFGALIYLFIRQNELEKKRKLFESELQLAKLAELKTKAELDALQARINPHFLYNALNSIADLSVADGHKAREMTLALADLFRYSINYSNSNFATVADEMEMVNLYLQIEKIRFEERFQYKVAIDPEALTCTVPRALLQPVVENAVKHGLRNLQEAFINIRIKVAESDLKIEVHDNGPAFPDDMQPGYGLTSLFDKLEALFAGQYDVAMHNQPEKCFAITLYNLKK